MRKFFWPNIFDSLFFWCFCWKIPHKFLYLRFKKRQNRLGFLFKRTFGVVLEPKNWKKSAKNRQVWKTENLRTTFSSTIWKKCCFWVSQICYFCFPKQYRVGQRSSGDFLSRRPSETKKNFKKNFQKVDRGPKRVFEGRGRGGNR